MNVVMYVMNDLRHDSRVIREARALAAAGHQVTVMTTTPASPEPESSQPEREPTSVEPFDTIAVAIPRRWPLWYVWLKHPWRLAGRAWAEARSVRRQPGRARHAVAYAALSIASIPWMVIRGAWDLLTRVLLRRPARPGVLDYLLRWRVFTLGWTRRAAERAPRADVHHANDMDTLPAALAAAKRDGAAVVYDSHEIFLESGSHGRQPRWVRWAMRRWERRMVGRTAALVTINDVCAAELGRRLRPRRIVVVHTCSPRWDPPSFPDDRIRRATGIAADAPVVLCHGGFGAGRGIEETAAAMRLPSLAEAHLVLLGRPTPAVDSVLRTFPDRNRIHVLPPVPPDDVVAWVAGADVDVMTLLPVGLNHVVSTPNKLFESIAAGVPVVSSDFPARRAIVLGDPAGPLGELCDPTDPTVIAAAIARLLGLGPEARADLRRRILTAAHERWNWETESTKLVDLYASLAGDRAGAVAPP